MDQKENDRIQNNVAREIVENCVKPMIERGVEPSSSFRTWCLVAIVDRTGWRDQA